MHESERSAAAISELLHWIWSCRLQLHRWIESTRAEWSGGEEATRLSQARGFSRTSYDEHLVLVTGRHLVAAVELVEPLYPEITIDPDLAGQLKLLRHIYEHWDDPWKGVPIKAIEKLRNNYPGGREKIVEYGADDWTLCKTISVWVL